MEAHVKEKNYPKLVAKRLGRIDNLVGPLREISLAQNLLRGCGEDFVVFDYSPHFLSTLLL